MLPNPYAPPLHEPEPNELARRGESALRIQLVLQIVLAVFHGLLLLSTFISLARFMAGVDPAQLVDSGDAAFESGRRVGRVLGFFVSFAWGFGGGIWCVVNAIAITTRKPWTYLSLRAYWITALVSVCCLPFGIIGLIHLHKPEVKYVLGRET